MAKPRHKRKRTLAEHDGEQIRVTRADGTVGLGILRCEFDPMGRLGRVFIERMRLIRAFARLGNYTLFKAAIDIPIKGFPDWWKISGAYVQLSCYTTEFWMGPNMTRVVMDNLG